MMQEKYQVWIALIGGGSIFSIAGVFGFIIRSMIDRKIHRALHQEDGTSTYVPRTVCRETHETICRKLTEMHNDIKELMKM